MKRCKNRLVVEITTSKPLTPKEAQSALSLLLDRIDLEAKPIWPHGDDSNYAEKLVVKEFDRTVRTLIRFGNWSGELP